MASVNNESKPASAPAAASALTAEELTKMNQKKIDASKLQQQVQEKFSIYASNSEIMEFMSEVLTDPKWSNVPEQLKLEMIQAANSTRSQFQAFITNMLKQMQDMAMQVIQNMRS